MPDADLSSIQPLERVDGQVASAVTFEYLRRLILEGALAPGTILSQVALATRLGVSRNPVREALNALQQDGLVEMERNRRARVAGFEPDDLEVVYASRIFYEPLGLFETVPKLEPVELAAIEASLADMRRASAENDYAAWEHAHHEFHALLAVHASGALRRRIAIHATKGDRYRRLYHRDANQHWNVGDPEHEAITRACKSRDPELAALHLARHIAMIAFSLLAKAVPEREPVLVRSALRLVSAGLRQGTPGAG